METAAGTDISRGLEAVPVTCEEGAEPPNFQYTPDHVVGAGSDVDPSEVTFPGCSCQTTPCVSGSCPCLRYGDNYNNLHLQVDKATGACSRPVFECNIMCNCGESCPNRVVQRSLQTRLQLFRTAKKGWGVRPLESIPKGRFVCEYAGEVLGAHEARKRIRQQRPCNSNYLIAVREHLHSGQIMETFVDPAHIGNVGRFLNHSCQPNLLMVPVRIDSMVPRLALFATRDIPVGEELCYDYSGRFQNSQGSVKGQEKTEYRDPVKTCYCGSEFCFGSLPYDADLYRTTCEGESCTNDV